MERSQLGKRSRDALKVPRRDAALSNQGPWIPHAVIRRHDARKIAHSQSNRPGKIPLSDLKWKEPGHMAVRFHNAHADVLAHGIEHLRILRREERARQRRIPVLIRPPTLNQSS